MTPKQSEVYLVIDEFWKKFGFGPTIDDIMKFTGDKGRGNVARICKALCKIGACKKTPRMARSIRPAYIKFRDLE
jgi:SOS-response transcriptional repressor LexA